jgi:fatty-acyl-CoA synthase
VKALVTAQRHKSSDYVDVLESLAPEIAQGAPGDLALTRLPDLRTAIQIGETSRPGWLSLDAVPALATPQGLRAIADLAPRLDRNDAANIQFTSGTTGHPKGATLTHRNLVNNALFVGLGQKLGPADRLCIPVPLYHCFGMVMGNLACLVHGATMVYASEGFDPLAVLETLERERCTALYGVPTMFIAELDHPEFDRFDLSSLRTGLMAGSPCPVDVMRRVIGRMHMPQVGIAYGMTETSPVSFQTAPDDPIDRRVATVGRVQPHLECKIIGEDGEIVPRGQPGELCTRGYSVMLGYWNDPERTAETLDGEGWMHTGDIAVIDDEGYGAIVGRIKDMIIRGGENVYPREIEEYLHGHPKVADVQVVGVPCPKYGEEVCAWIKLREGESADAEEIRDFCRGQIAHFKTPRYVRFVDSYPMTVTGKIQKYQMRAAMIAELGLSPVAG